MLALSRRFGQALWIGPEIRVVLVRPQGSGSATLGVEAPPEFLILREELRARAGAREKEREKEKQKEREKVSNSSSNSNSNSRKSASASNTNTKRAPAPALGGLPDA
jgi:carbon storage regulator CsrA